MSSFFTECLKDEAKAINYAASKLCSEEIKKSIEIIENCLETKSKLIISGVGKSGIVARKMAATFTSAGGLALYLNPLDAMHGDLGVLNETDVCIFLSNSGETEELLEIIAHTKKRRLKIISIIGKKNTSIGRLSDAVLETNVDKEVCPLNLAPTTSTTVAMAIGDALATVWMKRKGITTEDFAFNHPSGILGKKISLSVSDLMIPIDKLHFLTPNDSFNEILEVITKDALGTACVINPKEKTKLLGIITDGDLRRSLERNSSENWKNLRAKDIMSSNPITINETMLALEALKVMEGKYNRIVASLPVINSKNNSLIGLLRIHHLVQAGLKEI